VDDESVLELVDPELVVDDESVLELVVPELVVDDESVLELVVPELVVDDEELVVSSNLLPFFFAHELFAQPQEVSSIHFVSVECVVHKS